jgi:transcriptional regulator with XRE-family HTH domain
MTGKELQTIRKRLGLTQAEFAVKIGYHGQASVARMESTPKVSRTVELLTRHLLRQVSAT